MPPWVHSPVPTKTRVCSQLVRLSSQHVLDSIPTPAMNLLFCVAFLLLFGKSVHFLCMHRCKCMCSRACRARGYWRASSSASFSLTHTHLCTHMFVCLLACFVLFDTGFHYVAWTWYVDHTSLEFRERSPCLHAHPCWDQRCVPQLWTVCLCLRQTLPWSWNLLID